MAAVALVMLIVGFLLGTRGRQIAQSLKHLGEAIRSITVRIPKTLDADAAAAAAAGADDNDVEDEGPSAAADLMDEFLSVEQTGLDDHPDVLVNPVLLYQIRLEKDRQRALKRRDELKRLLGDTDGMSAEEIETRMAEQELAGGAVGPGDVKQNALALLISVGARVTSMRSDSNEAMAAAERRRLNKNIDVYLQKALDVEIRKEPKAGEKEAVKTKKKNREGLRLQTAYEVARETEYRAHHVHDGQVRAKHNLAVAKDSRTILRDFEVKRRVQRARDGDADDESEDSDGNTGENKKKGLQRGRAGGGAMPTASDIAQLALEFEGDEDGDRGGLERDPDDEEEGLAA